MSEPQGFPCKFQLPWSNVFGTATFVDSDPRHRHVLRLRVHRSFFDTAVRWISSCLPGPLRKGIQTALPGPFLPPTVIIKKLKPTWDAEFDDEVRVYRKLAPLQGHAVPVFFGEGRCDGTRALLLSDIGGVNLYGDRVRHMSKARLKSMLKPTVRALLELGVEPADQNPRNYHLVGEKVFVLDFEDTADVNPEEIEELAEAVADGVAHWTRFYHKHNSR